MQIVTVQKTNTPAVTPQPFSEELNRRIEEIRQRAFELFEARGAGFGRELDDWLQAERDVLGLPMPELAEKDGAYEIQVTLPDFDARDIQVTAAPGEIAILAGSEQSQVFQRVWLPEGTDVERVEARLEGGVLRVSAPKGVARAEPVHHNVLAAA